MNINDFSGLLRRKVGTIFTLTFIIVIAVVGLSLTNPLKYSSRSRLLVVQNAAGSDSYAVSRSNEYLGKLFSEVTYSGSFFSLVLNSQYKVDRSYFGGSYGEQIKLWRKTVSTKTLADTGIVEIEVYHPNPEQARVIALAVSDVLINQNANFQGGGEGVKVSVLDQPLVSDYPDHPNLVYGFVFALAAGLAFSLVFIYLFPEKRYDVRLWPKRRKKIASRPEEMLRSEAKEVFEARGDMDGILK